MQVRPVPHIPEWANDPGAVTKAQRMLVRSQSYAFLRHFVPSNMNLLLVPTVKLQLNSPAALTCAGHTCHTKPSVMRSKAWNSLITRRELAEDNPDMSKQCH